MEPIRFEDAELYKPDEGWRRVSLPSSDRGIRVVREAPPVIHRPRHEYENEQVCLVLEEEFTVVTEEDQLTLYPNDSALLGAWESHRVENAGAERTVDLDVFAPGRSFDFWTDDQ